MKKFLSLLFSIVFFLSCNSRKNDAVQQHQEVVKQEDSLQLKTDWNTGEDCTLQLHLKGIRYDSMSLICVNMKTFHGYRVNGESADGRNWMFSIPDSLYHLTSNFLFDPKLKGEKSNIIRHRIIFKSFQNGDTLNHSNVLPLDRKIVNIYAKYLDTHVKENVPMVDIVAGDNKTFFGSYHADRCEMSSEINPDFELQGKYPAFPYIPAYKEDTYDNFIARCLEIIKKYPDSQYLTGCVAENRTVFCTKESLQKLFAAFSKKNRQSEFGKIIDDYLKHYFTFSNMKLPKYENGNMEFVIQDSTKMNLIVFSASWCKPCHEMIPLMKSVYRDLHDRLNITYISMDEEKTADNWRKQMKDDSIPWRSLMAEYDIKTVQATYNPTGAIPFALLVYPNKTVEIIEIRQKDQKEKLYSVCNDFQK